MIDTGQYEARQTVTDSAADNDAVFAQHRRRLAARRLRADAAPDLLAAVQAAYALLTDPDADEFDANRLEAQLRKVIEQATGVTP